MRRFLIGVLATGLFFTFGVVTAAAAGGPEVDATAGHFTASFTATTKSCTGEDGGKYNTITLVLKGTSAGSIASGDFGVSGPLTGMAKVTFNQATGFGWGTGSLTVTTSSTTKVSGPLTIVVGPPLTTGAMLTARGLFIGTSTKSGVATGDIVVVNIELARTGSTTLTGSWGGASSVRDWSVKITKVTC